MDESDTLRHDIDAAASHRHSGSRPGTPGNAPPDPPGASGRSDPPPLVLDADTRTNSGQRTAPGAGPKPAGLAASRQADRPASSQLSADAVSGGRAATRPNDASPPRDRGPKSFAAERTWGLKPMFTRPRQTTGSRPEPVLQRKGKADAGDDAPPETEVPRLTPLRGWARRRTGSEAAADASQAPGPGSAATGRRRATEPPHALMYAVPDDEPPLHAHRQDDARQPAVEPASSAVPFGGDETAASGPLEHVESEDPATETAPIDLPEAPAPIASTADADPADMQPPPPQESAAPEPSETAPAEPQTDAAQTTGKEPAAAVTGLGERSEDEWPGPTASAPAEAVEAEADAPPEAGPAIGAASEPRDPDPEQTSGAADSDVAEDGAAGPHTAEALPAQTGEDERPQAETAAGSGAPGGAGAEQFDPSGADLEPADGSVMAAAAEPAPADGARSRRNPSASVDPVEPEDPDATEAPAAQQTQDDDAALEARVLAEVAKELEHRADRTAAAQESAPVSMPEQPEPAPAPEKAQPADRAELREIVREILREEMQATMAAEIDRRVQSVMADRLMQAFAPRSGG